jgi:hypothetical protein
VLNETRTEPFSAADVVMLPDEEENNAYIPAVMSLRSTIGFDLSRPGLEASDGSSGSGRKRRRGDLSGPVDWYALETAWTFAAARAAAATASLFWSSVEFAGAAGHEPNDDLPPVNSRINVHVLGARVEAAAMEAALSVCELPVADGIPTHVQALKGLKTWKNMGADASGSSRALSQLPILSFSSLVGIEQVVWIHLLTLLSLLRTARGVAGAPQPLPKALRELSPPSPYEGWPEGPASYLPALPPMREYPAVRRAQKMSYVVTAMLTDLSQADRCAQPVAARRCKRVGPLQYGRLWWCFGMRNGDSRTSSAAAQWSDGWPFTPGNGCLQLSHNSNGRGRSSLMMGIPTFFLFSGGGGGSVGWGWGQVGFCPKAATGCQAGSVRMRLQMTFGDARKAGRNRGRRRSDMGVESGCIRYL